MALGMNNAFQSLGRVAGPLWAGLLFDLNANLPYLSAAVILLATFGYVLWNRRSELAILAPENPEVSETQEGLV